MKGKILGLLLGVFVGIHSQAQYIPLVDEGKYWIMESYSSMDIPNIEAGFLITFERDTIIDGMSYKNVVQKELKGSHPCPPDQRPCFKFEIPYTTTDNKVIGFIHENVTERKVYFKPVKEVYCDSTVYVLFDFDLSVGDSLDQCKRVAIGNKPEFGAIESIEKTIVYSKERRTLNTYGFASYIGLLHTQNVSIIEGVGFEKTGLFHRYNNLDELVDYCEGSLEDCNIVSSSLDLDRATESVFMYPNPFNDIISVPLDIKEVWIYNLSGTMVYNLKRAGQHDLSNLPSGLYIVKAIATKGSTYTSRLFKN